MEGSTLLIVEWQEVRADLLREQTVYLVPRTVRMHLPRLHEELSLQRRVGRHHLELHHVQNSHQQGHAVVTAPVFQMRLCIVELRPQVFHRFQVSLAPGRKIQVELAQPQLEVFGIIEGALLLPLLQLAPLERIAPDLRPGKPDPSVDILQTSPFVLWCFVKLQCVEVDCREARTDDVYGVEVIQGEQAGVAPRDVNLNCAIHQKLVYDSQRANIVRVEIGRGSTSTYGEIGLHQALHFLSSDSSYAHLVQVVFQRKLADRQLFRKQSVPGSLEAITKLLPCVEEEHLTLPALL
mmetsp:Transcript_11164/g.30868  ORF Transcript_11164/g.30868 Transcript_11164/m.30868 type:complete len:294 (-) Transcript_11164:463-1344(-)